MNDYKSTEEDELSSEFTSSSKSGRYTSGYKKIDKKVSRRRKSIIMLISVLLISLLLTAFVYMRSLISEASAAYYLKVSELQASGLELSYDPAFSNDYNTLKGLGYNNTNKNEGGSLLNPLGGMNTTMFDVFKELAEDKDYTPETAGDYDIAGAYLSDQYYANKFFIRNNQEVSKNSTLYYRIRVEYTTNTNNAIDAVRFMYVNYVDDGTPAGKYEYHILATPVKKDGEYILKDQYDSDGKLTVRSSEIAARPFDMNPLSTNFKNPNLGHEKEDWYCENLIEDDKTGYWYWASYDDKLGYSEFYSLEPGQSTSYTICCWLEASDPDHNDSIKNGKVSFTVYFDVMHDFDPNNI